MANPKWPRISQMTLADQVHEAVRDRILSGELAPGDFVREQEMSEAMGVSRTPIREALGRLASECFLERIPHRGFRVPDEPLTELLDLYPVVGALESLAGELAFPKLGEDDWRRLREINEELREVLERGDIDTAIELNDRFHHYIAERSGNERLSQLLHDLLSQLSRLEAWYYSSRSRAEQSVREHSELIEALEGGNLEAAQALFAENMKGTAAIFTEVAMLGSAGADMPPEVAAGYDSFGSGD